MRAFNKEEALVGAFPVIVKTDRSFSALMKTFLCRVMKTLPWPQQPSTDIRNAEAEAATTWSCHTAQGRGGRHPRLLGDFYINIIKV